MGQRRASPVLLILSWNTHALHIPMRYRAMVLTRDHKGLHTLAQLEVI